MKGGGLSCRQGCLWQTTLSLARDSARRNKDVGQEALAWGPGLRPFQLDAETWVAVNTGSLHSFPLEYFLNPEYSYCNNTEREKSFPRPLNTLAPIINHNSRNSDMIIALVSLGRCHNDGLRLTDHYWISNYGGAERVSLRAMDLRDIKLLLLFLLLFSQFIINPSGNIGQK